MNALLEKPLRNLTCVFVRFSSFCGPFLIFYIRLNALCYHTSVFPPKPSQTSKTKVRANLRHPKVKVHKKSVNRTKTDCLIFVLFLYP